MPQISYLEAYKRQGQDSGRPLRTAPCFFLGVVMNLPIRKLQGGKEYKKFLGGKPLTRKPNREMVFSSFVIFFDICTF